MRFGSVCSGIEAASVAWRPLGWDAAWLSEIEPFPCAVLAHHYPDVPNLGDMTALPERIASGEVEAPDVFCGGTPCQAFSVAGLRKSLDDARGNLSLVFCEIANAIDTARAVCGQPPAIIFWENVPGVLSTKDNAFGCFLAGLAGEDGELQPPGGKWSNAGCVFGPQRTVAWRVLDAQYFGVAQRRRRVFVVASARKGFDPAQVLFEWDGVRRDTAPSREARQTAPTIPARSSAGGGLGTDFDCDGGVIQAYGGNNQSGPDGVGVQRDRAYTLEARSEVQCVAFNSRQDPVSGNVFGALDTCSPQAQAVAVSLRGRDGGATAELGDDIQNCLRASSGGGDKPHVLTAMQVRRLTPRECERLQGFPDDYTLIPWKAHQAWAKKNGTHSSGKSFEEWLIETTGRGLRQPTTQDCPNSPRYKALGNSWAVPNVRWIGRRIQAALRNSYRPAQANQGLHPFTKDSP